MCLGVQQEQKAALRQGLAGLPAPSDDFEIVLPDSDTQTDEDRHKEEDYIEDQSDIDAGKLSALKAQRITK